MLLNQDFGQGELLHDEVGDTLGQTVILTEIICEQPITLLLSNQNSFFQSRQRGYIFFKFLGI